FCNVRPSAVIQALDVDTIYAVPLAYHAEGYDHEVCRHFGIDTKEPDLSKWQQVVDRIRSPEGEVNIAIVGKYTSLLDAYKSLAEALRHGGIANNQKVNLNWIDSEIFARERKVPYFGICFGMQMAVIEAARNLVGVKHASSTEFGPTDEPVVGLMTEWLRGNMLEKRKAGGDLGGTMRLGAYECDVTPGSLIAGIYGKTRISERHRHRYEVNINYKERLEKAGLKFSGMSPDGVLPEMVEIPDHPWFVGVQFHPELKSRLFEPHPLFTSFISAAKTQSRLV